MDDDLVERRRTHIGPQSDRAISGEVVPLVIRSGHVVLVGEIIGKAKRKVVHGRIMPLLGNGIIGEAKDIARKNSEKAKS
jgi:hypothetical protein